MNPEILKNIIIEGQEILRMVSPVSRNFEFEPHARYVLVGVRQCGKSYLMYIRALQLIKEGHDIREMVFINFDDERLIGYKASELDDILKAYSSLFDYRPILFLDEIQNVEGWEHFARRLANQKYEVYLTGSNAKMLSKEIATTLGGRYLKVMVWPYSFPEYLKANGCEIDHNWMYGAKRGEVERWLKNYLLWGGFPELILFVNKRHWLNELYDKIILGDIIQRNSIKNEMALKLSLRRLAENIKNPTSLTRLTAMVKATGISTNVASVSSYIEYCKEACLLFSLENFASKFVERTTIRKHYFIDNGLLNIFLTDSETTLLENLCAVSLHRKSFQDEDYKPYFYNKEVELDFYLPALKIGIQACYSLADSATEEREVRALLTFHKKYGLNRADIVTFSEERVITTPELPINVVPLSKFLLSL